MPTLEEGTALPPWATAPRSPLILSARPTVFSFPIWKVTTFPESPSREFTDCLIETPPDSPCRGTRLHPWPPRRCYHQALKHRLLLYSTTFFLLQILGKGRPGIWGLGHGPRGGLGGERTRWERANEHSVERQAQGFLERPSLEFSDI